MQLAETVTTNAERSAPSAEKEGLHGCVPSQQYDALLEQRDQLEIDIATHHKSAWALRLAEVESTGTESIELLRREAEELSRKRYGDDQLQFCCEPPAVSRLSNLSTRSAGEQAVQTKIQCVLTKLLLVRDGLLRDLKAMKGKGLFQDVQRLGNVLADVSREYFHTKSLDELVVRRLKISWARLAAYYNKCELREHAEDRYDVLMKGLTANAEGYRRILDFYRHTDSRVHSFGRQRKGPGCGLPWLQRFADMRSNVTILSATDHAGAPTYCRFAVSGKGAPGVAEPNDDESMELLHAQRCEEYRADGQHGKMYSREYDAEFKVVWDFLQSIRLRHSSHSGGRVELWSRKAPCASCSDVMHRQLPMLLPTYEVRVTVHDPCEIA